VLGNGVVCYYAINRQAIRIQTGQRFESYLVNVLQKKETKRVHLYYSQDYDVLNQEKELIPDDNKWVEEETES